MQSLKSTLILHNKSMQITVILSIDIVNMIFYLVPDHNAHRNVSKGQVEHTVEEPMQLVLGSANFSANAIEKNMCLGFHTDNLN